MDYSKLGQIPINEQNPVGEDVKYDEDFEKVESEISKLTSPSVSNEVDWDLVVKLCESILQNKSKNLLVSVYLSYALFKKRSIDGLCDGIKVLADMLQNYWESLYPPVRRMKGRINAIEWMLDKLSKELESVDSFEIDSDRKGDFLKDLKRIDDFLNEHLDDAPLFYNLIKLVDMKLVSKSIKFQEEIKETVVEVEEKEQQKDQESTPQKSHMSSGDVEKDFNTMVSSLNILTGEMIEAKDYRSELFVINRAFAWLDIDELPSSEKNITMLPPPDTQEIDILKKLYDEKSYEALLWAAESRIITYLFWLDLHYYVYEALKNLGYIQAAQSVLEQTLYFTTKLPKLQNLSFSDSMPFANKMTKQWLNSQNKPKETKEVLQTSKIQDIECNQKGIDKLCELINQSLPVEDKVLYNIEMCRCLADGANKTLIVTYVKELLDRIKKYKTNEWSPKIALDAYLISVRCLEKVDEEDELLKELYNKIALLKPSLVDEIKG